MPRSRVGQKLEQTFHGAVSRNVRVPVVLHDLRFFPANGKYLSSVHQPVGERQVGFSYAAYGVGDFSLGVHRNEPGV